MDLDRLGLAGMSFGGSTTGSVCSIDPRCKAGVNLDGWQFGEVIDRPLAVPLLYFTAANNNTFPIYLGSSANLYEVHVKGSEHGGFTDFTPAFPIFSWAAKIGLPMLGTIDGDRMEAIMNIYSLAFFQQYLQGKAGAIEAAHAAANFPEVRFTKVPAPPPTAPPTAP
jgi:predicted dienelactone hydrolase